MSDAGEFAGIELAEPQVRAVEGRDASRFYGRHRALHDCSFEARSGDSWAVVGPNGAGKSTLLNLLATIVKPSEGAVVFNGRYDSFADRGRIRAHVGLVAHDSLLYADLTGRENLGFYADLYGVGGDDRVAEWIERVGLRGAADQPVGAYSRGMKQRLCIARALMHEPSVVLLDEPLTGLDRSGQGFLWDLVRWLRAQRRIVFVVTHRFSAPEGVFSHAMVLDRGRTRALVEDPSDIGAIYDRALQRRVTRGARA